MVLLVTVSLLSAAGDPGHATAGATPPAYLVATQPAQDVIRMPTDPPPDAGEPRWGAIGVHYGIGVMATAGALAGSYGLGTFIGHQGNGLAGPLVGLLIGALLPPLIITTAQWGIWQIAYPDKDRYWPSLIAAFACHLAVFVGSVLGGVALDSNAAIGLIMLESFTLPAATTTTAYLTRYRDPVLARAPRGAPSDSVGFSVRLLEVSF